VSAVSSFIAGHSLSWGEVDRSSSRGEEQTGEKILD